MKELAHVRYELERLAHLRLSIPLDARRTAEYRRLADREGQLLGLQRAELTLAGRR